MLQDSGQYIGAPRAPILSAAETLAGAFIPQTAAAARGGAGRRGGGKRRAAAIRPLSDRGSFAAVSSASAAGSAGGGTSTASAGASSKRDGLRKATSIRRIVSQRIQELDDGRTLGGHAKTRLLSSSAGAALEAAFDRHPLTEAEWDIATEAAAGGSAHAGGAGGAGKPTGSAGLDVGAALAAVAAARASGQAVHAGMVASSAPVPRSSVFVRPSSSAPMARGMLDDSDEGDDDEDDAAHSAGDGFDHPSSGGTAAARVGVWSTMTTATDATVRKHTATTLHRDSADVAGAHTGGGGGDFDPHFMPSPTSGGGERQSRRSISFASAAAVAASVVGASPPSASRVRSRSIGSGGGSGRGLGAVIKGTGSPHTPDSLGGDGSLGAAGGGGGGSIGRARPWSLRGTPVDWTTYEAPSSPPAAAGKVRLPVAGETRVVGSPPSPREATISTGSADNRGRSSSVMARARQPVMSLDHHFRGAGSTGAATAGSGAGGGGSSYMPSLEARAVGAASIRRSGSFAGFFGAARSMVTGHSGAGGDVATIARSLNLAGGVLSTALGGGDNDGPRRDDDDEETDLDRAVAAALASLDDDDAAELGVGAGAGDGDRSGDEGADGDDDDDEEEGAGPGDYDTCDESPSAAAQRARPHIPAVLQPEYADILLDGSEVEAMQYIYIHHIGTIVKRGHFFASWRRRFFVLEQCKITYWVDKWSEDFDWPAPHPSTVVAVPAKAGAFVTAGDADAEELGKLARETLSQFPADQKATIPWPLDAPKPPAQLRPSAAQASQAARHMGKRRGEILLGPLSRAFCVNIVGRPHCFCVTSADGKRAFLCCAPNQGARREWVRVIQHNIRVRQRWERRKTLWKAGEKAAADRAAALEQSAGVGELATAAVSQSEVAIPISALLLDFGTAPLPPRM